MNVSPGFHHPHVSRRAALQAGSIGLLGLGMNLLLGLAGVLDLGYAVSFGLGSYVTAIITNRFSG